MPSDNIIGKGFKNQRGGTSGLCDCLRPPNEFSGTFYYGRPGSRLPLPTDTPLVYSLTVQDSYHVTTSDGEVGYLTGSDPVWQDTTDAAFHDEDVLWEAHGDSGGNASVNATGHQIDADVGTAVLSGVAAYTASGGVGNADVGTAVARGAGAVTVSGDVLNADAGTPTIAGAGVAAPGGDVGQADVGTAVPAGAAAVSVSGDVLAADVGAAVAAGETVQALAVEDSYHANVADSIDPVISGDIVVNATGDELAADVGTAVLSGQARYSATGDGLAADVGIPTIGGAGIAAPGGDVGQADVGTVHTAGTAVVTATGHELAADVGDAVVSTQYLLAADDSHVVHHADEPVLVLANGDAFPAGVEAQADAGGAVALGAGAVPVTQPRGRRRVPVPWSWPEETQAEPLPEPVIDALVRVRGVQARASVGTVRVVTSARVIPIADFGRSRVGIVRAEVDYTLRDQQEEELIQLLLAA